MQVFRVPALLATFCSCSFLLSQQPKSDPLHAWITAKDPVALEAWTHERLDRAKANVNKLLAVKRSRTVENTLRPFDDAGNELFVAACNNNLLYSLADQAAMRDKAQAMEAMVLSAMTDLNLNQEVYRALVAIPEPADGATRYYLAHILLEYRLGGVDKDNATRAKIGALINQITKLSLVFGRNVADGILKISAKPEELEGLPADYVARHKPGPNGMVILTTNEPDLEPVMSFAKSAGLRRRMYLAYNNRAYPANVQVLKDLLAARQDLAVILGYRHWADLAMADQMIGSVADAVKLIGDVECGLQARGAAGIQPPAGICKAAGPGSGRHHRCRHLLLDRTV